MHNCALIISHQLVACSSPRVVISSAFESSCGISVLAQLASALDPHRGPPVAHGLGTLSWFGRDVVPQPLQIRGRRVETGSRSGSGSELSYSASVDEASLLLRDLARSHLAQNTPSPSPSAPDVFAASHRMASLQIRIRIRISGVDAPLSYTFRGTQLHPSPSAISRRKLQVALRPQHQQHKQPPNCAPTHPATDLGPSPAASAPPPPPPAPLTQFVFLHGFLGSCEDWTPLMKAVAEAGHSAVALDLPGHGDTVTGPLGSRSRSGLEETVTRPYPKTATGAAAVDQLSSSGLDGPDGALGSAMQYSTTDAAVHPGYGICLLYTSDAADE